jgi:hypothetical protein
MRILMLAAMVAAFAGCTDRGKLAEATLVGKWNCDPVRKQKGGLDLMLVEQVSYRSDHAFEKFSTSTVTSPGSTRTLVMSTRAWGTWTLAGDELFRDEKRSEFLGSSDLAFSREQGQKMEDEARRRQSVSKFRIEGFDGTRASFVVMDYKGPGKEFRLDCTRAAAP